MNSIATRENGIVKVSPEMVEAIAKLTPAMRKAYDMIMSRSHEVGEGIAKRTAEALAKRGLATMIYQEGSAWWGVRKFDQLDTYETPSKDEWLYQGAEIVRVVDYDAYTDDCRIVSDSPDVPTRYASIYDLVPLTVAVKAIAPVKVSDEEWASAIAENERKNSATEELADWERELLASTPKFVLMPNANDGTDVYTGAGYATNDRMGHTYARGDVWFAKMEDGLISGKNLGSFEDNESAIDAIMRENDQSGESGTWLVTEDATGEEIGIIESSDVNDADLSEDYGTGYSARRLTVREAESRVRPVDQVTTPELYY